MSTDSEYEFHIEDLLADSMSPGLRMRTDYDMPQLRDQTNNFECLETIISAIVNGCNFGKLCLHHSKEPRTWLYNAVTLTDSFVVSLHKNDIIKMIEGQKRRILNDQMMFMKSIPTPDFNLLSKKKLQNLCEALQVAEYIKGSTIFNQDDPQKYIYIVKEGLFAS